MGMMGYRELKGRLMNTTAFLVACGSLIAFSAGGAEAAYPFAVGGSAALGYQWLLQQSVDSIPNKIPRRTLVKVSMGQLSSRQALLKICASSKCMLVWMIGGHGRSLVLGVCSVLLLQFGHSKRMPA